VYARVTWFEGAGERAREAVRGIRELALPAARSAPGFEGLMFLVDRNAGRALAVTLWASLEDLENSEELAGQLRSLPIARWSAGGTERYEVAVRAGRPPARSG
jgi:hypothetical protein